MFWNNSSASRDSRAIIWALAVVLEAICTRTTRFSHEDAAKIGNLEMQTYRVQDGEVMIASVGTRGNDH